ncbi:MAG TPA: EamA family transporter [Thermoanaerobaculia bacterium]|nr:EamA family transporter [Thermoanaerobaculia bacterium]
MKHEKALAYVAFGIVCFVWGTTYLAIRVAIETLPTLLFPGLRFLIAGIVLASVRLARGDRLPRTRAEWANLALIGCLMIGIANVAVVWAEHSVTSGFAALLVATAPFSMAVMESFRAEGDRLDARKRWGMAIGFLGVVILVLPELAGSKFDLRFLLGVLALQGGVVAWNFGSMRSKYRAPKTSTLMSAALQMILGGAIVTILGLLAGEAPEFRFSPRTLAAFLYLIVFGSILAYGAYVYALSKLKTTTVSLYTYINPAIALVLGWLILSEPLGWNVLAGSAVIFAGMALVQSGRFKPTAQPRVAPVVVSEERVA